MRIVALACVAISALSFGQPDTLISVAITTGTITNVPYRTSSDQPTTPARAGTLPVNSLPTLSPVEETDGMKFTRPMLADRIMTVAAYPAGTTVQLQMYKKKKAVGQCTGNLVAPNLVLTAAHCLVNPATRRPDCDEIIVASAGTNTIDGGRLASRARSALMLKSYYDQEGREDIMLLELEDPIGEHTGWIGLSCRGDSSFIESTLFHKFSFPAQVQEVSFGATTGRQLHYNYGSIGFISSDVLGIIGEPAPHATPGQSGSSFLYTDRDKWYSVGVSIYSRMYQHQRITKEIFDAFEPVILESITGMNTLPYVLYPNPVRQSAVLKVATPMTRYTLLILNTNGDIVRTRSGANSDTVMIDRENLSAGEYSFRLQDDAGRAARGLLRIE
jgi:hypothetical protein